jgi:hypothetical protein
MDHLWPAAPYLLLLQHHWHCFASSHAWAERLAAWLSSAVPQGLAWLILIVV